MKKSGCEPPVFSLWQWAKRLVSGNPHFVIPGRHGDYLRRWYLFPRNPYFNIYLHHMLESDEEFGLHDHPWHSVSFLLSGSLTETYSKHPRFYWADKRQTIDTPIPVFRKATLAHRLDVHPMGAWTLFITGPKIRRWGFWSNTPDNGRRWIDRTEK